ncbi:hypothetical protein F9802_02795 [Bacillus aerolatus]|uniref:DUF4181 domain-containing protein n=1 Tax=Bacillus aerolatus TaxID=2653354 RepID=A0A6I1FK37_9BACI|nr:hypothetical protein F9802_02795 [Bacillus aerolatus]
MYLLRLPFTRWTIFCAIILVLLFTNYLGVFTFFVLGAGFSILESYLTKKNFDKKTGNKFIDYGWSGLWLITLAIILTFVFK